MNTLFAAISSQFFSPFGNYRDLKDAEKIHHELHDMLALAINQARSLMMEISPPVLHDLGLGAAIDWMAERMISEHGTEVVTVRTGDFSDLEHNLTIMLYQMTRELLANVVKHSGGHHVLVTVERDQQAIGITVRDDGKSRRSYH